MRHWEMLYDRPPLGLDAALFGVALLLHAPLLLVQFKAAPHTHRAEPRVVKVELLENLNTQVFSNPISVRPTTGPVIKSPIDMPEYKALLQRIQAARLKGDLLHVVKPHVVPPASPKAGLGTGPIKLPDAGLNNKGAFNHVAAPQLGSGPAGLKGGSAAAGPAATGRPLGDIGGGPAGPALLGNKGSFSIRSGQIGSIGSGEGIKVGAGGAGAIAIKTTKTGSVDDAVLDPIPVQDKGRFGALGGGDGSGGTLAGGAAHAGVPGGTGNVFAGGAAGIATGSVSRAQRPAFTITGPLGGRQVIYQEKPEYPAILRAKGIESAVHLRFVVTAEGNVKDVSIVRTSGYPDMDRSAVRALRKWSFVPLDHFEDQEGTIIMTFSLR